MPTVYEQILAAREDMTEWLVHFTRDSGGLTAREVLVKILAEGLLRPGWATRTNRNNVTKNHVFGPRPAVCFSEQPVGALIQYVAIRDFAAPYGVFVHKLDAWADGALPVLYGLHADSELGADNDAHVAGQRTLNPTVLSVDEQYRYVALALHRVGAGPLDWTHEREWRWSSTPRGHAIEGAFPLCGSPIYSNLGHSKGRVHVFVKRDSDVAWLKASLTAAWNAVRSGADEDYTWYCDRWFGKLRNKVHVFSLEEASRELAAGNRAVYRLETWLATHAHNPIV